MTSAPCVSISKHRPQGCKVPRKQLPGGVLLPHLRSSPRVSGRGAGRAGRGERWCVGLAWSRADGALPGTRGAGWVLWLSSRWAAFCCPQASCGRTSADSCSQPLPTRSLFSEGGGESSLAYDLEKVGVLGGQWQRGLFRATLHPHLATNGTWLFVF